MTEQDEAKSESEDEKECESSEDSEEEILDTVEFQRRLEIDYRKVILSELQFNKVKAIVKELKLKQLLIKRKEIEDGISCDLVNRNTQAYEDYEHQKQTAITIRGLELDSLERKIIGQQRISEKDQEDNAILIKERLIERLTNEKDQLESVLISAGTMEEHLLREPEVKRPKRDFSSLRRDLDDLNYPVVLLSLSGEEKRSDIESIEISRLASRNRKDLKNLKI